MANSAHSSILLAYWPRHWLLVEPAILLTWVVCYLIGFNPRWLRALQTG